MERRYISHDIGSIEVRGSGSDRATIHGYGAVFYRENDLGTEYRIMDDWVERIMPEAFDAALDRGDDVRSLFNHDTNLVLGRTANKTLTLDVDRRGLLYTVTPPDTQTVRDQVVEPIRRGDVSGSSFMFEPDDIVWRDDNSQVFVTEVRSVRLWEVGPVTFPAYQSTSANVRSDASKAYKRWSQIKKRGESLASALNSAIDDMVNEDRGRGEIIEAMGSAAGISADTVREILSGEINCPPLDRLAGLASALSGVTAGQLRAAAERDGCEYGGDERSNCGCCKTPAAIRNRNISRAVEIESDIF